MSHRPLERIARAAGLLAGLAALTAWSACGEATPTPPDAVDAADVSADATPDSGLAPDVGPEVVADVVADVGPIDLVPPTFRSLRVTVEGPFGVELDLGVEDAAHVLPIAAAATFRVFVQDDVTAIEDLLLRVIDERAPDAPPEQLLELHNGLWRVALTITPGASLRVVAEDQAGNAAPSPGALHLPTQGEALLGEWEGRTYQVGQVIGERWTTRFVDDGTWVEERLEGAAQRGGSFVTTDDDPTQLQLAERWSSDGDSDAETVEREERSRYYVDTTYLSVAPFVQVEAAGPGPGGTWTRTVAIDAPVAGTLQLAETRTETLVLGDDGTWSETWTGTRTTEAGDEPIDATWAGTYLLEVNDDYVENVGDFLVRTVSHVDGVATDAEPVRVELFARRLDLLLLSPAIREL